MKTKVTLIILGVLLYAFIALMYLNVLKDSNNTGVIIEINYIPEHVVEYNMNDTINLQFNIKEHYNIALKNENNNIIFKIIDDDNTFHKGDTIVLKNNKIYHLN